MAEPNNKHKEQLNHGMILKKLSVLLKTCQSRTVEWALILSTGIVQSRCNSIASAIKYNGASFAVSQVYDIVPCVLHLCCSLNWHGAVYAVLMLCAKMPDLSSHSITLVAIEQQNITPMGSSPSIPHHRQLTTEPLVRPMMHSFPWTQFRMYSYGKQMAHPSSVHSSGGGKAFKTTKTNTGTRDQVSL